MVDAPVPTPRACAFDGCTTEIGLQMFSVSAQTLRQLGFAAGDEPLVVRVCTHHYLLAMHEILTRLGLPRAEPKVAAPSPMRLPDAPPPVTP